jgi:phosphate transport system protein
MNVHTIQRFDNDLDKLRSRLIKMCTLVQQQMGFTLKALSESDKQLAELIKANDDKIDKVDIKIDKQCLEIFAVHQPLASDLRLVLTALSINDMFELIGDSIVDIANCIIDIQAEPYLIRKTKIVQMAEVLEKMLSKVVDSYIYANYELAKESFEIIQQIKALRKQNVEILAGLVKENAEHAIACLTLQDINRNLKFIADLSVNVAQEIVFLAEARNIKHQYKKQNSENPESLPAQIDDDNQDSEE